MAKKPPISQIKGRTLGRILTKMGVLTRDKVHECLKIQKQRGNKQKLGQILIELELITKEDLGVALAGQRGMEFVKIDAYNIPSEVIAYVPAQMARTYRIVPIEFDKGRNELTVALDSPDNFRATDDLSTLMGFAVTAKVTDTTTLENALTKYYADKEESLNDLIGEIEGDTALTEFRGRDASIDLEELKELAESNPVKKLLNLVLLQAIRDKA